MRSRSDTTKTSPPASGCQARAEPRCGAALPRLRLRKMVRSWWVMIRAERSGAFRTMGSGSTRRRTHVPRAYDCRSGSTRSADWAGKGLSRQHAHRTEVVDMMGMLKLCGTKGLYDETLPP